MILRNNNNMSLNLYLFEGRSSTGPATSSHQIRNKFVNTVQQERSDRLRARQQVEAAVAIQTKYRQYRQRRAYLSSLRELFDKTQQDVRLGDCSTMLRLLYRLTVFFAPDQDIVRAVNCAAVAVQRSSELLAFCATSHNTVSDSISSVMVLCRFTLLCIRCIIVVNSPSYPSVDQQRHTNVLLRAIEIFVSSQHRTIVEYCAARDYFPMVRQLLQVRVPVLEVETEKAPVAFAESVLKLCRHGLVDGSNTCITAFIQNLVVHTPLSSQVRLFLLPSLLAWDQFPSANYLTVCASIDSDRYESLNCEPAAILSWFTVNVVRRNAERTSADLILQALSATLRTSFDRLSPAWHELYVRSVMSAMDEECIVSACIQAGDVARLCSLCYALLSIHNEQERPNRLLYALAFRPGFLDQVWKHISTVEHESSFGSRSVLESLQRGSLPTSLHARVIAPPLRTFCYLLNRNLLAVQDTELRSPTEGSVVQLTLSNLTSLSAQLRDLALGLVQLAFPDGSSRPTHTAMETRSRDAATMFELFSAVVDAVQLIYDRDSRMHFCPAGHWIALPEHTRLNPNIFRKSRNRRGQDMFARPATAASTLGLKMAMQSTSNEHAMEDDDDTASGPPLSPADQRRASILRNVPFTVPFKDRVEIFQHLILADRDENNIERDSAWWNGGRAVDVRVRRTHLYEDAFDRLSFANAPSIKPPLRVHMINWAGLDEAGIDGGGIFREFLNELLRDAFDPSRGFFVTTSDGLLYPNPAAPALFPDDYHKHFMFIGRVLGKVLYENLMVEIPFAPFFLLKILNRSATLQQLDTLDPVLYRNLLYLKTYGGDVRELLLNFAIMVEQLGEVKVVDLKSNGRNIDVDELNRIEFIHLVADFHLNKQIKQQTIAFRDGLSDLIDLDLLLMFAPAELQTLISGADREIDVEDMRGAVEYSGGYSDKHPTIELFWQVLDEMSLADQRKLLKFVTSCSRPPLLGFKNLFPPFNIQMVKGDDALERLPTAATCMNLLKLPPLEDVEKLREKVLYAIRADEGFELS